MLNTILLYIPYRERQKMIKEQIEQAAKPKTPLPLPVERRSLIIIIYHTCIICTCTCIFTNTTDCEISLLKNATYP